LCCRGQAKGELVAALQRYFSRADPAWETVGKSLQAVEHESYSRDRANAFLPYAQNSCFDDLADDWIAILRLNITGFDVFPHLVNLAGLHLIKYQLSVARQLVGYSAPPSFVCEVVAPRKTLVREISCELYQANNLLPAQAVEAYIAKVESSPAWKQVLTESGAFEKCRAILGDTVRWGDDSDYSGPSDPEQLMEALRQAAMKRHRQHVANIHRNYGRDIGLVSKRGTVKLRYAPNDSLLKTLLFANVDKRMELNDFLAKLESRYGIVFGDREAEHVLPKGDFDKKAFRANSRRLEQRLASLGILKRLSDACAYVINPYHEETA